jgi:Protein of unknown function (DUF3551)
MAKTQWNSISCTTPEDFHCYFLAPMVPTLRNGHVSIPGVKAPQRENDMKNILSMTGAPATAMLALAFVALATPAAAGEYCRQDITSGMRSCSFSTLEQCQATSAGRGGDCYRDPFLEKNSTSSGNTNNAFAYQPASSHAKRVRKPAVNQ